VRYRILFIIFKLNQPAVESDFLRERREFKAKKDKKAKKFYREFQREMKQAASHNGEAVRTRYDFLGLFQLRKKQKPVHIM